MNEKLEKKIRILLPLVFIVIPVLIFLPYYLEGQVPGTDDLTQYFSSKEYLAECILKGSFPQWNPYLSNGIPQSGVGGFDIASLFFLFMPLQQAVYLLYITFLFIGALFFYLFLRQSKCSYVVSVVFAVLFECSIQINGLRRNHPSVIAAICLFPVIMYFVKKFIVTRRTRWLCIGAVVAGVQATMMLQYSIYANLILFIYILFSCRYQNFTWLEIIKKAILWCAVWFGIYAYVFFPTSSILGEYTEYGSSATSYGVFIGWSVHPIKLIQMIIPCFFGEYDMPLGTAYSSEHDIELYLGIFVLLLAMVFVTKKRKSQNVRLEMLCALIAFLYAALAHIPFIGLIVYHIPLLGGFRCAARMLYIFYFFVLSLAAQGLEDLFRKDSFTEQIMRLKKFSMRLLWGVGIIVAFGMFLAFFDVAQEQQQEYFMKLQNRFFLPLFYIGLITLTICFLCKKEINNHIFSVKWKRYVACVLVLLITLAETLPYSLYSETSSLAKVQQSETEQKLKEKLGNSKVWDVLDELDISHESMVSQNKGQLKGIPSINAYTAYNNPCLVKYLETVGDSDVPFNSSGLLSGTFNARNVIAFKQEFLSMIGVRYLIDSSGLLEEMGGRIYDSEMGVSTVAVMDNMLLEGGVDVVTPCAKDIVGGLQGNACYKVRFRINEEDNKHLSNLAVDLYGGPAYDRTFQQTDFVLTEGKNEYEAYLYTSQPELATEDIRMRILFQSDIDTVRIETCEISLYPMIEKYQYWGTDENGVKIYENPDAKDILYFPKRVKRMREFDDIYSDYVRYHYSRTAYVDRKSRKLYRVKSDVKLLSCKEDKIEARVTSEDDTYLCFSQNYSPNWSVEIDGKKQEVDMVNGLIMGTEIPKGEHVVIFKYEDSACYIGYAVTTTTVVLLVVVGIASWQKRRRGNRRKGKRG
ncbi:MAG: YfhO family protein [Roseburia sp.]|nr:YfhO family protein [Roseburia sp.]